MQFLRLLVRILPEMFSRVSIFHSRSLSALRGWNSKGTGAHIHLAAHISLHFPWFLPSQVLAELPSVPRGLWDLALEPSLVYQPHARADEVSLQKLFLTGGQGELGTVLAPPGPGEWQSLPAAVLACSSQRQRPRPHQPCSSCSSCSDHAGRMEVVAKFCLAGLGFLFLSPTACKKAFKRWDTSLCFPHGHCLFMTFFPLSPKGLEVT